LGDDTEELERDLKARFPQAKLLDDDEFEQLVANVIGFIDAPALAFDVRGTAFQQRVWQAVCDVPVGSTVSYTDIAQRIGAAKSVRVAAAACAANILAVVIPCHRVVRKDGNLSGYRWGVDRKA
jgi:AraC family transcriptional regulator of adaptative response/methylated-DNA-[protein]-cysteine methyltransferase